MGSKPLTQEQTEFYNRVISLLKKNSIEICKMNKCTEDNHNCDSYAYFDYEKDLETYELVDICGPDYRTKCDDSYIPMPIPEDYTIENLINDLELNDIREEDEPNQ